MMLQNKPASRIPWKERRDELVNIAYDEIAQHGLEGLRFHVVAQAAGINNATLCYYFSTKEDLIQGVVSKLKRDFSHAPILESTSNSPSAADEIRRVFDECRKQLVENPAQLTVYIELLTLAWRDPATAQAFAEIDQAWHQRLVEIIERGIRSGEFHPTLDSSALATMIMTEIRGIYLNLLGQRDTPRVEAVISQILQQVIRTLTG